MVLGGFASVCLFGEEPSEGETEGLDFVELGLKVLRGIAIGFPIVRDFQHQLCFLRQQLKCVASGSWAFASQFPSLHREVLPVCNEHHRSAITALIMVYFYVSAQAGKNLQKYKYQASDLSIIYNYVLSPLSEVLVRYVPRTVS